MDNKIDKDKNEEGVSLHLLKPEEALSAFMKVSQEDYKEWYKKEKKEK